jgi:hypothetical protein
MKDAGIRIRVEKELREAFVTVCQAEDKKASDVLREFMQTYVERRQGGQGDLFSGPVKHPVHTKVKTVRSRQSILLE